MVKGMPVTDPHTMQSHDDNVFFTQIIFLLIKGPFSDPKRLFFSDTYPEDIWKTINNSYFQILSMQLILISPL